LGEKTPMLNRITKRQKVVIIDVAVVLVVTAVVVVAMANFKDYVNRSEATRAMQHLGEVVLQYRENHGQVPPESYIDDIKEQLHGYARLGTLHYRGRWIDIESKPDEILAYTVKNYHSLIVHSGVVVLRFDGKVEWMKKEEFDKLLARQQSPTELDYPEPR
jgi:hypothetical protein